MLCHVTVLMVGNMEGTWKSLRVSKNENRKRNKAGWLHLLHSMQVAKNNE